VSTTTLSVLHRLQQQQQHNKTTKNSETVASRRNQQHTTDSGRSPPLVSPLHRTTTSDFSSLFVGELLERA
jgi:hypothetical protein